MKKSIFAAAAVVLTTTGIGSALAADMAVKAPFLKAPVATVYDWTGFYIGANAGVGLGRDYSRLDIPAGLSFERSLIRKVPLAEGRSATTGRLPDPLSVLSSSASKPIFREPACAIISVV